jgi:hypothetical protein
MFSSLKSFHNNYETLDCETNRRDVKLAKLNFDSLTVTRVTCGRAPQNLGHGIDHLSPMSY